jgi:hypothetical protein
MGISTSRLAFHDCYDLLDQAIADDRGIRVKLESQGSATQFRMRLNQARRLDRQDNKEALPEDHPMHGRSEYDKLTIRLFTDDEGSWIHIERLDTRTSEVESLAAWEAAKRKEAVADSEPTPGLRSQSGVSLIRRRV